MRMSHWLRPKSRSLLGVDLSLSCVKLLELSLSNKVVCVEGYAALQLPTPAMALNSPEIRSSLEKLLTLMPPLTDKVAIGLPDAQVLTKCIDLPTSLTEAEIERLIEHRAERYFGYPISQLNFDFVVLANNPSSTTMQVLLVAALREEVSLLVALLSQLGLKTLCVEVRSFVLRAVLSRFFPEGSTGENPQEEEALNPFKHLTFARHLNTDHFAQQGAQFLVALGLALRLAHES
jgi:type IV pilus assembly protein PilM